MRKKITILGCENKLYNDTDYIKMAEKLCNMLANENISIITKGNSEIMKAANKSSLIVDKYLSEVIYTNYQIDQNEYKSSDMDQDKFRCEAEETNLLQSSICKNNSYILPENIKIVDKISERKELFRTDIECSIFFPGGIETLNEFTELLELYRINEILAKPIFLVGYKYWNSLKDWFRFNNIEWHDKYIYYIGDNITEMYDEIMINITNVDKNWKITLQEDNININDKNNIDFKLPKMNLDNEIIIEISEDDDINTILDKTIKSIIYPNINPQDNAFMDIQEPLISKDKNSSNPELDDIMKEIIDKFEKDFGKFNDLDENKNQNTSETLPELTNEENNNDLHNNDKPNDNDPNKDKISEISIELKLMSIDSDSESDDKN